MAIFAVLVMAYLTCFFHLCSMIYFSAFLGTFVQVFLDVVFKLIIYKRQIIVGSFSLS